MFFYFRKLYFFIFRKPDFHYPRPLNNERKALLSTLYSGKWNSAGKGIHTELEKNFANYIGTEYAIAVNTGGMAIQMICRVIGLQPGDEVIHQVDTCVATSFAVMNAMAVPVFADISPDTLMLEKQSVLDNITPKTKMILPVHIWGYPENMDMICEIAKEKNLLIIEDACLSLGAEWGDKKAGSIGIASAFSFGCLKPIQSGEGGMIVTNDSSLAKELCVLRNWGETTNELGYRDNKRLAWNGRISEFAAAVANEQLKGYASFLEKIRENVSIFISSVKNIEGLSVLESAKGIPSYNQVILKYNPSKTGISKKELMTVLKNNNIHVWHSNFEPINSLSFFKNGEWEKWMMKDNKNFIKKNYESNFQNSYNHYENIGIGINKIHFLSKRNVNDLIRKFQNCLKE